MVAIPLPVLGEVKVDGELLFYFVLGREECGSQRQNSLLLFYQ